MAMMGDPNAQVKEAEELSGRIDELLAKNVSGVEEAQVLERAHELVNEALGNG